MRTNLLKSQLALELKRRLRGLEPGEGRGSVPGRGGASPSRGEGSREEWGGERRRGAGPRGRRPVDRR